MIDLQIDKIQTYYCHLCNGWLELCFDRYIENYEGINLDLSDIPLLHCDKYNKYYFPEKTKELILVGTEKAKEKGELGFRPTPKKGYKRRFKYGQVKFLYDYRDYENIPGLERPWDDGFLTPVFFNLAVLNKYSQHPNYRIDLISKTYGTINKSSEFEIAFGINRNKKVIMWLGDISELPEDEQYYLRSENIKSDHELHSEFYDAQIEVIPSNLSPENTLFRIRAEVNQKCEQT